MCVAVVVPAGQRLTEEQLRSMHEQNPDSWGFAFYVKYASHVTSSQPGYVRAVKGVSDTASMVAAYNKAVEELSGENGLEVEHLAHFRIATSGKKDHTNAHPFYIAGGMLIPVHSNAVQLPATRHDQGTERIPRPADWRVQQAGYAAQRWHPYHHQ